MATEEDVISAVKEVSRTASRFGWYPKRATHIAKESYSLLFLDSKENGVERLVSAVKAISSVQEKVWRKGWEHSPLVLVFPMGDFRLATFIPSWARVRGRKTVRIGHALVRTFSEADTRFIDILKKDVAKFKHIIANTVQESVAAYAWYLWWKPTYIARNVELTIPTPYPDPIRTRTRAMRDYGITVSEFDAIGVRKNELRIMEAKAASGGKRRWENIVRRKIRSYKGAYYYMRRIRRVPAEFVVTSNNRNVAEKYARITAREVCGPEPFAEGHVLAVWGRKTIEYLTVK